MYKKILTTMAHLFNKKKRTHNFFSQASSVSSLINLVYVVAEYHFKIKYIATTGAIIIITSMLCYCHTKKGFWHTLSIFHIHTYAYVFH